MKNSHVTLVAVVGLFLFPVSVRNIRVILNVSICGKSNIDKWGSFLSVKWFLGMACMVQEVLAVIIWLLMCRAVHMHGHHHEQSS